MEDAHATGTGVPTSRTAPWAGERAQYRMVELERALPEPSVEQVTDFVSSALQAHARQFDDEGVVLYAGTNALSPRVQQAHAAQLSSRSSMGWPAEKYQMGLDHLETLEVAAPALVSRAVGARFAEVRSHSATMANLAAYTAFACPGDTIATLPQVAGGHVSHHEIGVPGVRGLHVAELPYDAAGLDVDIEALPAFLSRERPRLVVVGASLMLFPHRLRQIARAVHDAGIVLLYDASHVAGLVAGGRFQQPLAEGADLLTFSTYKSFGGPAGGVIATNDPTLAEKVSDAVYPTLSANYDAARLAPLAIAAAENLEHGGGLADRYTANAHALATALDEAGLCVAGKHRGFTSSHHVAVDVGDLGDGAAVMRRLSEAGIYLSAIDLPDQQPHEPTRGLRLGTQEVTRRGFEPTDMKHLAACMAEVLLHAADPASVRGKVTDLRRATAARHPSSSS